MAFFNKYLLFVLLIAFNKAPAQTGVPSRNDHIFPAAPSAKAYANYDSHGFLINGKRTFIASADMDYARVPRALWHDRLLRLKRAGFNAVEMYTFWNFHEPQEGKFNFSGDHDLDAFLKMIRSVGMYAIVRVGPYYCGEWNLGGYPIWLKVKPGIRVRENDAQFLAAVDKFFNKLIPIVSANQVTHGGAVIMVQLENEHRAAWGTVIPNAYFRHLKNKAVSLGLQVPYFFSGLHSGNDPAGDVTNLDDPARPNPWFSAEYWGVWFLNYGPQEQDSTLYDRRTWKIIAHGGNGYNVYMAHGGTNFGYNNDRDNAASYDYGASVGQAGDLRPIYFSFKRANWFVRSFQDILENSTGTINNSLTVADTSIKITARQSPAGTITFLDNPDSVAHQFTLKLPGYPSATIRLASGEIMPVVQDYQLTRYVKIHYAPVRIYGIIPQKKTTSILIYGDTGSMAQLYFKVPKTAKYTQDKSCFKWAEGLLSFSATIHTQPASYSFKVNKQCIRIVVADRQMASKTWLARAGNQTYIVMGPEYVDHIGSKNNKLSLVTEHPWAVRGKLPVWIFKPRGNVIKLNAGPYPAKHLTQLKLGQWKTREATQPASPGYDDHNWMLTKHPQQMGADGDITADAWYRTKIKVKQTGNYTLQFTNIHDRAELFIDGKRADTGEVFNKTVPLYLTGGINHTVALFTAHNGRNKLIFKVGRIDTLDAKGLTGPVTLQKEGGTGPAIAVTNWRMRGGPFSSSVRGDGYKALLHTFQQTKLYRRSTLKGPKFYYTTLNLPPLKNSYAIWRVNTTSLSYGSVWVNGHNLGRYPEKIKINGLYIPSCWLKTGSNTLLIYDENGISPAKVSVEAEAAASRDIQTLWF